MDSDTFNTGRIWNVGMFFDFDVVIEPKYIRLVKSHEQFAVVVVCDYTQDNILEENVIYMELEFSNRIVDLEVIKEFNKVITQATMIIEQLNDLENWE